MRMQSLVCTVIVKSIALNLARFSVVACALLLVVSVGYWSSALFVILSTEFVSCCVRRRFNSQLDTPKQGKHRNTYGKMITDSRPRNTLRIIINNNNKTITLFDFVNCSLCYQY